MCPPQRADATCVVITRLLFLARTCKVGGASEPKETAKRQNVTPPGGSTVGSSLCSCNPTVASLKPTLYGVCVAAIRSMSAACWVYVSVQYRLRCCAEEHHLVKLPFDRQLAISKQRRPRSLLHARCSLDGVDGYLRPKREDPCSFLVSRASENFRRSYFPNVAPLTGGELSRS